MIAASRFSTYRPPRQSANSAGPRGPHEETLEATVGWYMDREHDRIVHSAAPAAPVPGGDAAISLGERTVSRR